MNASLNRAARNDIIMPIAGMALLLLLWELFTRFDGVPAYILPGPLDVL